MKRKSTLRGPVIRSTQGRYICFLRDFTGYSNSSFSGWKRIISFVPRHFCQRTNLFILIFSPKDKVSHPQTIFSFLMFSKLFFEISKAARPFFFLVFSSHFSTFQSKGSTLWLVEIPEEITRSSHFFFFFLIISQYVM